jgi:hypothetical protein
LISKRIKLINMTFNNETNIVIGNKHNNEQQQHEHRTGRLTLLFSWKYFKNFTCQSFPRGNERLMSTLDTDILIRLIEIRLTSTILGAVITIYDCSICSLPICDQFVFKVNENHFHSLCLNCSECHMKLLDKCYARDGNVYCKEDFFK